MTIGRMRALLVGSAAGVALSLSAGSAQALQYNFGEVELYVDNTVSAGVQMRTAETYHNYISSGNGGPYNPAQSTSPTTLTSSSNIAGGDPAVAAAIKAASDPGVYNGSINGDDGRLNFDEWDLTSGNIKVTNDIQANWRNWTAFVRASGFYDAVLDRDGSYARSSIDDGARWDVAHN